MLVHNVLFWLKEGLTETDRAAFREGLETLVNIDTAQDVLIGTPAETAARPVVDKSFDFMLTVIFDSPADHDAYQDHPLHTAFVKNHSSQWNRIMVYDAT